MIAKIITHASTPTLQDKKSENTKIHGGDRSVLGVWVSTYTPLYAQAYTRRDAGLANENLPPSRADISPPPKYQGNTKMKKEGTYLQTYGPKRKPSKHAHDQNTGVYPQSPFFLVPRQPLFWFSRRSRHKDTHRADTQHQ